MARSIRCNPIPATRILRNTPASHPCGWLFVFLPIPAMPIRSQGTRQGWGPTGTAAMDMRGERNEQRRDHCCRNELHTGAGARAVSGRIDHQDQGEHLRDQEIFWQLQARAGGMRAGTRWIWIYGRAGGAFSRLGRGGTEAGAGADDDGLPAAWEIQFTSAGAAFWRVDACSGRDAGIQPRGESGRRLEGCAGRCGEAFDGETGLAESVAENFETNFGGRNFAADHPG